MKKREKEWERDIDQGVDGWKVIKVQQRQRVAVSHVEAKSYIISERI